MIIAVDGPSGAGKGTLARLIAAHYHLAFLDTGLLYRAVGAYMLEHSLELEDEVKAAEVATSINAQNMDETVLRRDEVAQAASKIAIFPLVRKALLGFQQTFAQSPPQDYQGVVLDGRDIGTRICPNANYKFFVTADVKIRAERRCKELQERGIMRIYSDVLEEMILRDQRDQQRSEWPLRPADDAIVIDTTSCTAQEAFNFAVSCMANSMLQTNISMQS